MPFGGVWRFVTQGCLSAYLVRRTSRGGCDSWKSEKDLRAEKPCFISASYSVDRRADIAFSSALTGSLAVVSAAFPIMGIRAGAGYRRSLGHNVLSAFIVTYFALIVKCFLAKNRCIMQFWNKLSRILATFFDIIRVICPMVLIFRMNYSIIKTTGSFAQQKRKEHCLWIFW